MPVEQQQLAKEAVHSLATEVGSSIKDARLQRGAERAATLAQRQATPEQGLRALAYGERERLRTGKDWDEAKQQTEGWLKTAAKARKDSPTNADAVDAFFDASNAGKSIRESWSEARVVHSVGKQQRAEILQAQKDIQEFDAQHGEAIELEMDNLIDKAIEVKQDLLTTDEINTLRDQARHIVATEIQKEKNQQSTLRQELEDPANPDHLEIEKIILARQAEEQRRSKAALSKEDADRIREEALDELAAKGMEKIRNAEAQAQITQQQLLEHPKFLEHFKAALNGVDIVDATPDDIDKARKIAFENTRNDIEQETEARKQRVEAENQTMRQQQEWKDTYTRLKLQEIGKGTLIDSKVEAQLMDRADREIRTRQVEQDLTARQKDLAERQAEKGVADDRVVVAELRLEIKKLNQDAKAATGEAKKALLVQIEQVKQDLTDEIGRHTTAAQQARERATADPKDATLQKLADDLEARAKQIEALANGLYRAGMSHAEVIVSREQAARQAAESEVMKAQEAVARAELQRNILTNTDVAVRNIPDNVTQVTAGDVEQVNKALSAGTPEQRLAAINTLQKEAEKNKTGTAGIALLGLLLAIAAGLGAVTKEATKVK